MVISGNKMGESLKIAVVAISVSLCCTVKEARGNPQDIKSWQKELASSDRRAVLDSYRIAMLKKVRGNNPEFFSFDPEGVQYKTIIHYLGEREWALFKQLNPDRKPQKGKNLRIQLLTVMGASHLLFCPKACLLLAPQGNELKKIAQLPALPKEIDTDGWFKWWHKTLGYDAVVIDQKGDYLLAASVMPITSKNKVQALAYLDSANKFILSGEKSKGSAIMESVAVEGSYLIFQSLLGGNIEPGTKILISSK